jgi:putative addiction module component (TIGR02574 family)
MDRDEQAALGAMGGGNGGQRDIQVSLVMGACVMSEAAERLKSELAHLPAPERAALAHFLIHSLDEESEADAEAAWDTELIRRAEEIRSGKAVGEPADKVFAELREKHS